MNNQRISINKTRAKPKWIFLLYCISIIFVMYKSQSLMFTRPIPESVIYLIGAIISLIFTFISLKSNRRTTQNSIIIIYLVLLVYFYDTLFVIRLSVLSILIKICSVICVSSIILLPLLQKKQLLNIFINTTSILVLISEIGWFLYLLNIPLPHYTDTSHPYYIHTIYYFFNLNGYPELQILPRFAGMFLEPGHLGTICVFLLYIKRFYLKNKINIILLLGVLLSFSLAAYGLLVLCIILILYQNKKKIWIGIFASIFISIGILSSSINEGDNILYELIFQRLEVTDDGDIKGNNRTSKSFDYIYNNYLNTDRIWLGYGRDSLGNAEDGSNSLTIGCATYKRYFFLRGIIGSLLILLLLITYWWKNRSIRSSGFFILYLVANIIRDYPSEPIWLYTYLLVLPLIKNNEMYEKTSLVPRS